MWQQWLFIQPDDLSRKGEKFARSTFEISRNQQHDVITANSSGLPHELYFDNFFTSYSLMSDLTKIDVSKTGGWMF